MVINPLLANKISTAPSSPGVYIFKDTVGKVLYIGKAINLHKRLLYYTKNREDLYAKTAKFLEYAYKLDWIEVKSDLEAILLEMNLIRTLKPKYNSLNRDDKRPLFVHITNDPIPRIKTARMEIAGTGDYIGPFPSSQKLRSIMKRLRRIFPYCSCNANRKYGCMYVDLGLCPDPTALTTKEGIKEYRRSIQRLRLFLRGNIGKVIKILQKEMSEYAERLEYEKAQKIKNQIQAIEELLSNQQSISDYLSDDILIKEIRSSQKKALAQFLGLPNIDRIEGYDIANTSGTNPTASMVVFEHGLPNTSEYRKFKITKIVGANDPLMMYHVLQRRLKHPEWQLPDLILIDGGKTQVVAAMKAIHESSIHTRVIGLAKRFEQIVIPVTTGYDIITPPLDSPYLTLLRAIRDEAHRFSTTYHKKLRHKSMLNIK